MRKPPQRLARLMRQVKRATKAYGSRAALARRLGITPNELHNWLTLRHQPGGEQTLTLLEWLQHQTKQAKERTGENAHPVTSGRRPLLQKPPQRGKENIAQRLRRSRYPGVQETKAAP